MEEKAAQRSRDRVLGDEWLDWRGGSEPTEIREGTRTFIVLSLLVLVGFVALAILFWYLVLPRFEQYGRFYAYLLTAAVAAGAAFFLAWYGLLVAAIFSRRFYLAVCLHRGRGLLFALFPFVARLAISFGISRDRLSHSFIEVSNRLAAGGSGNGAVLALIPRCLGTALKLELRDLCAAFPDVVLHTAPGGTEARTIIRETKPRAIIAVACERDLVTGLHDVAPRIPVIGIPNIRPSGPCKDTALDVGKFREALLFFHHST